MDRRPNCGLLDSKEVTVTNAANAGTETARYLTLSADRGLLQRSSTADRVASILRTRLAEGYFAPGDRLAEETITSALGVSRNTLREAFRLLTHERLLEHRLNQGVFVRQLSAQDVRDSFRVRTIIECAAVRGAADPGPALEPLRAAVAAGEDALHRQHWQDLGTANIHFHQRLGALAGSPRLDEIMDSLLAELRLAFSVMADPGQLYRRYLPRNREILARLDAGDPAGAEQLLRAYLDDAQHQLIEAYADRAPAESGNRRALYAQ